MVRKKQIGLVSAWIYVFLVFVTSDNLMLFVASAILAVGFLLCCSSHNKIRVKGNAYFYIQLLFVGYCLFQMIVGIAVLKNVSWSASIRLIINCIDELMLFNILIRQEDIEDIFKSLIYPFAAGILLIIYLQIRSGSIFAYRLTTGAEDGTSYKFLGLTINAGVATMIGHCAVCMFAFCLIYYYATKQKKYALLSIIAAVGLVLSSSRKALAVAVALLIIVPEFREHNKKKLQQLFGAVLIIVIGYIIVMRVPVLYNMVGVRIERMFTVMRTGESVDYSMNVRSNLRTIAWNAFLQRPVEGWGVNSFKNLFNDGWIYSHCNYLELLVGTGIIGTIIFLSKYVYLFRKCTRISKMDVVEKFYCKCLAVWLLMVWVMEYWQVAYYNERMIVHYVFVLSILEWINKNELQNVTRKVRWCK